jgi:hypothetical protein
MTFRPDSKTPFRTFVCLMVGLLAVVFLSIPSSAEAASFYENAKKRQENKKRTRWTLAEWLATKERVRLMDQWLAMNTFDDPYEFYLGGDWTSLTYTTKTSTSETSEDRTVTRAYFATYASVFGLEGQYEVDSEQDTAWTAAFNLRLLGPSVQSTNVTLQYGVKSFVGEEGEDDINPQFAGVSMAIYLSKYFGVDGNYRFYMLKHLPSGDYLVGEAYQARAFIDYGLLQIYGRWFMEVLRTEQERVIQSRTTKEGFGAGATLFF